MKHFLRITFLAFLLLTACNSTPTLSEADEVEIYTAVIDQLYTRDDTFGGTFQAADTYILSQTDDRVGDPDIEQLEPQVLATAVQTEITAALAHLPTNIVWVESRTAVPLDDATGSVANNGIIITLGNIHPQSDGTALVSGSIYVGMLAAGGQTYILEQDGSGWQIQGTTGVQWIS
ncbi:MAG: hypothetical protein H6659_06380 [Ardenticatenaceae bacterium]|nr:hypothetical protein [Ardenticatenaceae bacterium]